MESETMQTLHIKEDLQADECSENIPPEVNKSAETSKVKVQTESEAIHSSTQRREENQPVSNICTLLTPSPTRGRDGSKAKSQLSGLSPVLRSSNIGNECPTPEPLKHGNSPHLSSDFYPLGFSTGNHQKSKGRSRRLISANDTSFFLLEDECLPEVSMLSLTTLELTTNDSVLSESVPASPKTNEIKQVRINVGGSNSRDLPLVVRTKSSENKSVPASTGILETEITLLDVSSNSEISPGCQMSSGDVLQDMSSFDCLKVSSCSEEIMAEPGSFNTIKSEDLSSKSVQSVKSATESTIGTSLEVTPEVTVGSILENGKSSSETSGQKMEKSQTSDKDKDDTQPFNITRDLSSSSDGSAHIFTSGNTEMPSEPLEDTNPMEKKHEENQTCCDIISTSELSTQSPESAVSGNRTFTQLTPSMNASSRCNTTASSSCGENKTLDYPPVNSPKASSETKSQTKSVTTKPSFVVSQDSLSEKESSHCGARLTFNKCSLQTTSNGSSLGEAAADVSVENKTFDCKSPPLKDGTITFSEVSLTDRHHTFDKPPSPKLCNVTTNLKHEDSDDRSSQPSTCEAATASEIKDKKVDKHYNTFEANTTAEIVSADGECKIKDLSQSGLPVTNSSSSTSNSQCVDVVDSEAPAFNLDETLDLRTDLLITSTPMTNYKMFTFGSDGEVDSNPAAQKMLYNNGPSKPADEEASDIAPSIGNPKTLKQPAIKSLRPLLKAAPQLSGSTVSGQLKRVMSGLPLKRSRLQTGAGRTSAASEEPQVTVVTSSSYNLRSLTAASKLPSSGLQKQQSRIPFGIPRVASGPGSSAARFGALASSSTNKSSGPSAAISVTKQSLGKKHLLQKGEAFPAAKKKKADAAVPASTAETSDRPSRFGALKPPGANQRAPLASPQHPVCAKCLAFEEKFKLQSEKIQRLEEELLKYRKQEDG